MNQAPEHAAATAHELAARTALSRHRGGRARTVADDGVEIEGLSTFAQRASSERVGMHTELPFKVDASRSGAVMARRRTDGTLRMVTPPTIPLPSLKGADFGSDESITSVFKTPGMASNRQTQSTAAAAEASAGATSRLTEEISRECADSSNLRGSRADLVLTPAARMCAQAGCEHAHKDVACLDDFRHCTNMALRLALPGYRVLRVGVREREILVIAEIEEEFNCCVRCGGLALRPEEYVDETIYDRPVGERKVVFFVDRVCSRCKDCGALTEQPLPGTATRQMSDRLLQWIAEQSAHRSLQDLAELAGINSGGYLAQLVDARRSGTQAGDSAWGATSGWITPPQLAQRE